MRQSDHATTMGVSGPTNIEYSTESLVSTYNPSRRVSRFDWVTWPATVPRLCPADPTTHNRDAPDSPIGPRSNEFRHSEHPSLSQQHSGTGRVRRERSGIPTNQSKHTQTVAISTIFLGALVVYRHRALPVRCQGIQFPAWRDAA